MDDHPFRNTSGRAAEIEDVLDRLDILEGAVASMSAMLEHVLNRSDELLERLTHIESNATYIAESVD